MKLSAMRGHRRRVLQYAAIGNWTAFLFYGDTSAAAELKKVRHVQIEQVQIAFIGSGNLGGGTLNYGGKAYDFTIDGLGIGGIGISARGALSSSMIYSQQTVRRRTVGRQHSRNGNGRIGPRSNCGVQFGSISRFSLT